MAIEIQHYRLASTTNDDGYLSEEFEILIPGNSLDYAWAAAVYQSWGEAERSTRGHAIMHVEAFRYFPYETTNPGRRFKIQIAVQAYYPMLEPNGSRNRYGRPGMGVGIQLLIPQQS